MGLTMATHVSESQPVSFEDVSSDPRLSAILDWIEQFLCAPNAALGRTGNVCPYAKTAILKRSLEFYRNYSTSVAGLASDMEQHLEEFLQSERSDDIYYCRLIVPDALGDASDAIEHVQKQLKPMFVENRLMVGQFFPDCAEPGLRNRDFRPLQTPVPLLAIRNMVLSDIAFLYGNERYVNAYLEKFEERGIVAIRQFEASMEAPE
jgi:hypothetical protein